MTNREQRRLMAKQEERDRKRRQQGAPAKTKERTGFRQYIREVRQELKKVAWPTREQTITYTVVVLTVTTILTIIIFALDYVLKTGMLKLLDVS